MGTVSSSSMKKLFGRLRPLFRKRKSRIGIVGLDAAGKTTLLYKIKQGEITTSISITGLYLETFECDNVRYTAWNIGGDSSLWFRATWHHLLVDCDAVVFVVDATDRYRIDDAKHELHIILANKELCHLKVLVFANKQDLLGAMSSEEVRARLELSEAMAFSTHVQPCVATTGQGVYAGLNWLSGALSDHFPPQRSVLAATSNQTKAHQAPSRSEPNKLMTKY